MKDKSQEERSNNDEEEDSPLEEATSIPEWIAAGLGGAIFIAMIGYLAVVGFNEVEGEPQVTVSTKPAVRQQTGYLVTFEATNSGRATATSLVIAGRLMDGEKEIEGREITIDYLPMQSSRAGGLFFRQDPARYRLEIEAQSYLDP